MTGGSSLVLKLLVEKYLSAGLIDTALFYAERLFYESASPENLHTFANCYFRKGKINQAYLLLHPREHWTTSSKNTYLFALCCVELDKLCEAEQALQPNTRFSEDITPTLESVSETAGHAAGVYLLGRICRLQQRKENAVNFYKLSLQMDPYLWCSITELSELGIDVNVEEMFRLQNTELLQNGVENNSHLYGDSAVKSPAADKSIFIKGKNLFADQTVIHPQNENDHDHSTFNINNESRYPQNTSNNNMSQYMNQSMNGDMNHSYSRKMYNMNITENMLLNNSLNPVDSHAVTNMHSQHSLTPPNHASMALGLTSMALRIPFGSPASMTSPLIVEGAYQMRQHQQMQQSYSGISSIGHISSLYGSAPSTGPSYHQTNRSYAQMQTDMMLTAEKSGDGSLMGGGGGNRNLFGNSEDISRHNHNIGMHTEDSRGRHRDEISGNVSTAGPSRALFGLPTPGLTPIPYNNRNNDLSTVMMDSAQSMYNGRDHLLDTSRKVGFDSQFDLTQDVEEEEEEGVGGGKTHIKARPPHNNDNNNMNKSLNFNDEEDDHEHPNHTISNAPHSALALLSTGLTTNNSNINVSVSVSVSRRVSFGPNATLSFGGADLHTGGLRSGARRVSLQDRDTFLSEEEEEVEDEDEVHDTSSFLQQSSVAFTPSVALTSRYPDTHTPNSPLAIATDSHRRRLEGESPFKLQRKTASPVPTPQNVSEVVVDDNSCEISPIRGSVDTTPAANTNNNTMNYTMNSSTMNRSLMNNTLPSNMSDISAIEHSSVNTPHNNQLNSIINNNNHHGLVSPFPMIQSPIFDVEQTAEKTKLLEKTPHKKRSMLPVRVVAPPHTTSATPNGVQGGAGTSFLSHLESSDEEDHTHKAHNHNALNNTYNNDISNISHNNIHMDQSLLLSPSHTTRKTAQISHTSPIHTNKVVKTEINTRTVVKNRNNVVSSPERHRVVTTTHSSPIRDATIKKSVNIVSAVKSKQQTSSSGATKHKTAASSSNSTDKKTDHPTHTTSTTASKVLQQITPDQYEHTHRLISIYARAYQHLSLYQSRQCIELLATLPLRHFKGGLTQQMLGRANYEMNNYKECVGFYREMLKVEPFRLSGMEILSTALWHLRKDKDLAALAMQVAAIDRLSPETWCVVGNCFSFQKEPETAIRFFERALQLDKQFVYAHTLSGHEQVNNEDLEKAILSFRSALLLNDRHYNAWYGLGSIYFRQERFELAEYHFKRALQINGESSVLHCYLGMALHSQNTRQKSVEALEVLNRACAEDPKNPQLHFQRAHILVSSDDLEEALEALLIVLSHAPMEPPVHALLGQVYHRLGRVGEAISHLNTAIDLDPKEAVGLKAILEHIDDPTAY